MSANAALLVVAALLCLHAVRSLPQAVTLDGEVFLFFQASAYRPTSNSVVDEKGHVVGKLVSDKGDKNQCKTVWRKLLSTVLVHVKILMRSTTRSHMQLFQRVTGRNAKGICAAQVYRRICLSESRIGLALCRACRMGL